MTLLLAIVGVLALSPEMFRLVGVAIAAGLDTYWDLRAWWTREA